jgi:hypothetical protein
MAGPFDTLIGEWDVEVPQFRGTGRMRFERLGPYLVQHSQAPDPVPDSIAIIGEGVMRYFDSRGVQRTYQSAVEGDVWRLWRDDPDDFSQRFTATIGEAAITAKWEKCMDGATWEHDFDMRFPRAGG